MGNWRKTRTRESPGFQGSIEKFSGADRRFDRIGVGIFTISYEKIGVASHPFAEVAVEIGDTENGNFLGARQGADAFRE